MQKREFDTRTETKSSLSRQVLKRQRDEHEARDARLPQRGPFEPLISGIGDVSSAGVHASMLNRATNGRPSRAGQSLLRLQRQYGNRYVQRVLALAGKGAGETEAAPELEQSIQQARGSGQALDSKVRGQMEPSFGVDFSGVRIHADTHADTLNRELNARAFTTGQDIFFRQDAYNPGNSSGRELIAHELTHVVQQNGDKVQRKLTLGQPGDKYEQEADQVARAVMQQEQQVVQKQSDGKLVRRQVEEEEVQMKAVGIQWRVKELEEKKEPIQTKADVAKVQRRATEEQSRQKKFLEDWENGIKKAKEYVKYVQMAIKWAHKHRRELPDEIKDVAMNLKKIAGTLELGINMIEEGTDVIQFIHSLFKLAVATDRLVLTEGSLDAWLEAVGQTNESADVVKSWVNSLAAKGSLIAARFSFLGNVLQAYIKLGVEAVKSVKASSDYRKERIEKAHIERRPEPPPRYPGDYKTVAEITLEEEEQKRDRMAKTRELIEYAKGRSRFSDFKLSVQCPEVVDAYQGQIKNRIKRRLEHIKPTKSKIDIEAVATSMWFDICEEHKNIPLLPTRRYVYHIKVWLPVEGVTTSWEIKLVD